MNRRSDKYYIVHRLGPEWKRFFFSISCSKFANNPHFSSEISELSKKTRTVRRYVSLIECSPKDEQPHELMNGKGFLGDCVYVKSSA